MIQNLDMDLDSMPTLIQGLGLKFWIKIIEEQHIEDVESCLKMIEYLQKHLNDLMPDQSNEHFILSGSEMTDVLSLMNFEDIGAVVLIIGKG